MIRTMKLIHAVFSDIEPALDAIVTLTDDGISLKDVGLTLPLPASDRRGRLLRRYADRVVRERAQKRSASLAEWLNHGVIIESGVGSLATIGLASGSSPSRHFDDPNWCILAVRGFPALEGRITEVVSGFGGTIEEIRVVGEENRSKDLDPDVLARRGERLKTTATKRNDVRQHSHPDNDGYQSVAS